MENVLLRVGGWDVVRGHETVRKRYAQKIIDNFIDLFSLSFGRFMTDEECAAHLADYRGGCVRPEVPVVDVNRHQLPLIVRFRAWHSALYRLAHERHNRAMAAVWDLAHSDSSIMPCKRYMSASEAVAVNMKRHAGHAVVV